MKVSSTRPLTPRQIEILVWLDGHDGPAAPSTIAYGIGMNRLPRIEGSGNGWGRGSGHRVFNPAQRIISSLTGLTNRGLIRPGRRPDDRSGTAYRLTDEGRKQARAIEVKA